MGEDFLKCKLAILTVIVFSVLTITGQALAQTENKSKQHKHSKEQGHKALTMLPKTHDWQVSTNLADRVFPGVKKWLWDCSSTEGGHGGFVWNNSYKNNSSATNYRNNIPGGQMQFKPSTFNAYLYLALSELRSKGFNIPTELVNFYEPLAQAVVAGYMREHGNDSGQWTGWKC